MPPDFSERAFVEVNESLEVNESFYPRCLKSVLAANLMSHYYVL